MTIPQAGRNPGMIFGVESSIDCQDQPTLHAPRSTVLDSLLGENTPQGRDIPYIM